MAVIPPWIAIGKMVVLANGYVSQRVMSVRYGDDSFTWWIKTEYGPADNYANAQHPTKWRSCRDYQPWNSDRRSFITNIKGKYPRNSWENHSGCDNKERRITTMQEFQNLHPTVPLTDVQAQHIEEEEDDMATPKKNTLYTWAGDDGKPAFGSFLAENSDGDYVMEVKGTAVPIVVSPDKVEKVMPYTVKLRGSNTMDSGHVHMKAKKGSVKRGDIIVMDDVDQIGILGHILEINSKCDRDNLKTLKGRKLATSPVQMEDDEVIEKP